MDTLVTKTIAPWTVDEGAELAYKWGHEDATEGRKRKPLTSWAVGGPEHTSYEQGYNDGLELLEALEGDDSGLMADIEAEREMFDQCVNGRLY